jgi:hypothetical protein
MSSLWSLVRKKKIQYAADVFTRNMASRIIEQLSGEPPKLVDLSDYATNYWAEEESQFDTQAADATPCFERMWFEWRMNEMRSAVFVHRHSIGEATAIVDAENLPKSPPDARFFLEFLVLTEQDEAVVMRGATFCFIDRLGCLDEISIFGPSEDRVAFGGHTRFVCEALTTINTKGTRIEPPFDSKTTQVVKPTRNPCSVWHTIHLPKFARPPLEDASVSPEVLERREHWVRAHPKDYRRGGGLFGRIKARIWVPEFQRGNPELGTVKQSYKVDRREPGRAGDTEPKALPPAKEA